MVNSAIFFEIKVPIVLHGMYVVDRHGQMHSYIKKLKNQYILVRLERK